MTHDERISSYIDNELTLEQEQEFLISLAASDGLRKSFRSELVLKKVLHRDETAVNPPHTLRRSVFMALGLAGADAIGAEHAQAAVQATTKSAFKSLFATKVSTLITAAGLGVSAMAGYGLHSVVNPSVAVAPHTIQISLPAAPATATPVSPFSQLQTVSPSAEQVQDHHQHAATVQPRTHARATPASTPNAVAIRSAALLVVGLF